MFDSNYNFSFTTDFLIIRDLGGQGSKSVTNDMENILTTILHSEGEKVKEKIIIYLDSMGIWDMVEAIFDDMNVISVRFLSLGGETDLVKASKKAMNIANPLRQLTPIEMTTYKRMRVHVLDPDPDQICIEDIAHALSNICRFGGHTSNFYSVAQHSVHVANLVPVELALDGLMHDAAEAYLGDVINPLKVLLEDYKKIEEKLLYLIAKKFGFNYPICAEVKKADSYMLIVEYKRFFTNSPVASGIDIIPLPPKVAEELFLKTFKEIQYVTQEETD